ncbi:OLC1v1034373C1 [Oldenlandia corymbosa var. corymbosa]|uniref:OLC1v1034373C1 n=1 Tax=Oldenlandia corymbosa var. corymbosa TaxID=529605 RepID=A0AAV1CS38_OLDCO|nr:OLC1v1034373C1 [Oldenlandia corymbosa var. corymbosa]
MEGWWKRGRTRSSWLWWAVVPLLLVFGLVLLWTTTTSSSSKMEAPAASLWSWPVSSLSSSSSGAHPFHMNITTLSASAEGSSSNVVEDPLSFSPPKEPQPPLSSHPDEVHNSSFRVKFSSSVSMPPDVSVDVNTHIDENPEMQKEELPGITADDSPVNLATNESHASPSNPKLRRKFSNLGRLEAELNLARSAIREAKNTNQSYDPDYIPTGPMYWNAKAFHSFGVILMI